MGKGKVTGREDANGGGKESGNERRRGEGDKRWGGISRGKCERLTFSPQQSGERCVGSFMSPDV
jgi:hypothetical protein